MELHQIFLIFYVSISTNQCYITIPILFSQVKSVLVVLLVFGDNVIDALTFQILTDDTQEVIHRFVARAANRIQNPYKRIFPLVGRYLYLTRQIYNWTILCN